MLKLKRFLCPFLAVLIAFSFCTFSVSAAETEYDYKSDCISLLTYNSDKNQDNLLVDNVGTFNAALSKGSYTVDEKGIYFNGSTGFTWPSPLTDNYGTYVIEVEIPSDTITSTATYWYKMSTIWGCELTGAQADWSIVIDNDKQLCLGWGSSNKKVIKPSANDAVRRIITVVVNTSGFNVYIDGVLALTQSVTLSGSKPTQWGIGWNLKESSSYFNGYIRSIAAYNVLNPSEEYIAGLSDYTFFGEYNNDNNDTGSSGGVSEDEKGFWASVGDFFESILDFLGGLWDKFTDILTYLFVPEDGFLDGKVEEAKNTMPFIATTTDLFTRLSDFFTETDFSEPPTITIELDKAEGKYDYGLKAKAVDFSWYTRYKPYVDITLSAIIWIGYIWLLYRRIPDIINGVGVMTDERYLYTGKGKER